jgi:hypothetical protein
MALTAILGMSGVGHYPTDQRPKSYSDAIDYLYPDLQLFLRVAMKLPRGKPATDPEHRWPYQVARPGRIQITAQALAAATDLTCAANSESWVREGHLLKHESSAGDEVLRVTSDPVAGSGTIETERAYSGTAGTIAANDYLTILLPVGPEGQDLPTPIGWSPEYDYNYIQEPFIPWNITDTESITTFRSDPKGAAKRRKRDAYEETVRFLARQILWGPRVQSSASRATRSFGGLVHFITTNVQAAIGSITWPELKGYVVTSAENGLSTDGALIVAGLEAKRHIIDACELMTNTRVNVVPTDRTYGLDIEEFNVAGRKVRIMEDQEMTMHPLYKQDAFLIDTKKIAFKTLPGRDLKHYPDQQPKGQDSLAGKWGIKCTLELKHESCMHWFQGISGSAAPA